MYYIIQINPNFEGKTMKKLFVAVILAFSVVLFAAADYRVLVLGDIHFEHAKYHGVPGVKYRTRYSPQYANMWQKAMPSLFNASAAQLGKDVPFVVQLGDFTQGYLALKDRRAQMLLDSFNTVKSYYPNHALFFAKGNHDVKVHGPKIAKGKDGKETVVMVKGKNGKESVKIATGWDNPTYARTVMPLIKKELSKNWNDPEKNSNIYLPNAGGNFAFRHGEDLYIFYDGLIKASASVNFLRNTLKKFPKNRYVFFITHLPVFPCTPKDPGWLLPRRKDVINLLFQHNTVILAAHTHLPSLMKVSNGKSSITQVVASSIGYAWNTGKPFDYHCKDFDSLLKLVSPQTLKRPRAKVPLDHMKTLKIESFESYRNATGFVILKVGSKGIDAEIYNTPSGKPAAVKKVK